MEISPVRKAFKQKLTMQDKKEHGGKVTSFFTL